MALTRKSVVLSALCLALLVGFALAGHEHGHEHHAEGSSAVDTDKLSLDELDAQLQTCSIVQDLNAAKHAHHAALPIPSPRASSQSSSPAPPL
ncbi:hypothetical protein NM208_g11096 [Fusarium decemcellulare]|uniref:Uncharacterized protein n=1 Tax=Fusarium decemcellulare TaxID=57161 RepID=A0ACC1RVI4_9HYPO|nr:hypothetical protein NM208_g11096 [Fusarium decemcellulare]